ncbi:aminodeoxychorismate synthase component I [Phytohalomonas tamaricis]|uniref:aminodeoxychorismate synthase component I n=1 Tax=Phytohalomonas tamaricis TaxID=2081032 RepID=UPI000D0B8911|nr:aminodeoxychorismate synthase component I [Phytohalomonas tamaricis]
MPQRLECHPLTYHRSPLAYFAQLRQRPGAVLLDSGRPEISSGRYDIMSSDPLSLLTTDQNGAVSCDAYPDLSPHPVKAQRELLAQLDLTLPETSLPFTAGLIGFWSYDFGRVVEPLPTQAVADIDFPLCRLGLYDWSIVQDHQQRTCWLLATPERRKQVLNWLAQPPPLDRPFTLASPFQPTITRAAYGQRFHRIQHYIHSGDCYQVNFAQRFSASYQGDLWHAYQALREATPTPFSAFMTWPDDSNRECGVLSLSPERFLRIDHGEILTQPIKGTRPRGVTPALDAQLAHDLQHSTKDRAENVMIVDLLRNDIGRVATPGSVHVPALAKLESYANVHHLVSTVTGTLATEHHALDALTAAFPGGSITGAPKIRAMQIIDELEPFQRSLYCGSIGYVDIRGHMDTSIVIRTAVASQGQLHLWGGGGIVADSNEQAEFDETLAKTGRLIAALEKTEG